MPRSLYLLFLLCLLPGCGGITRYVHRELPDQPGRSLSSVSLDVGESIRILKHTRGIAIGGGYIEGVAIEDPAIVGVLYGRDGQDEFAPQVFLKALKPGTTRAVYCNRLGEQPDFSKQLPSVFQSRSFLIQVN